MTASMRWLPPLTAFTALLLCVWLRFGAGEPVLADVARAAPAVRVDLGYATADNFFHRRFYTGNATDSGHCLPNGGTSMMPHGSSSAFWNEPPHRAAGSFRLRRGRAITPSVS